jgi:hypothetical protein
MKIKIGAARIDENGHISGGKIGDQTGKEVCVQAWYLEPEVPWNVYLECTDLQMADKAAKFMEQICANNNFGYSQDARYTGYNAIVKNGNKVSGAKGDFDCASLVLACYKLAGLSIDIHQNTKTMRKTLLATGKFKAFTDSKFIKSDAFAKRGGIYLNDTHHVVMALENASGSDSTNSGKVAQPTLKKGDNGSEVKKLQENLNKVIGAGLSADGDFGPKTETALKNFQSKYGLEVDGVYGPKSYAKMKSLIS